MWKDDETSRMERQLTGGLWVLWSMRWFQDCLPSMTVTSVWCTIRSWVLLSRSVPTCLQRYPWSPYGQIPSFQAFDICSRFLDRNPETRLGSASFEDICQHPWFSDIDWEKLYKKQVIPPFKPNVKSAEDVENVDREFLAEMPAVTPTFEGKVLTDPSAFEGFSYNPNPVNSNMWSVCWE